MPKAKEFYVIVLDESDGTQVFELALFETKRAEMIDLVFDLGDHFLGKHDVLVAAFEIILTAKIGMLMEDDLIHIEFVKIGIEKGNDDGFKLHIKAPRTIFSSGVFAVNDNNK
jgi:hypothetical protein